MRRLSRIALPALLIVAVLVPAVVARAQEVPACRPAGEMGGMSQNVEHICNIPDTGMISLVFAQTGNFFYASSVDTTSVYSYEMDDSGAPTNIALRSTVPTAEFENESMTYGERHDASGEVTERFVIVAEDQFNAAPRDQSFHVGGENVVIIDVTDPDGAFVRSTAEIPTNTHTVQCVDETQCDYAYSVGREGVFSVIDLTDLDDITVSDPLAELSSPAGGPNAVFTSGAGHDWWFDEAGIAWHTGSGGMAAFDATDPTNPVLLNQTDESGITTPLNDFILHNAVRPHANAYSDARPDNDQAALGKGNVALVTEEDYFNDGDEVDCNAAGMFETWHIPSLDGSAVSGADDEPGTGTIRNLDSINAPQEALDLPAGAFCSAHWFDYDDRGFVAQGWYQGGLHVLDVRDPSEIGVHAYSYLGASEVWDSYWFPVRDGDGRATDANHDTIITADFVRGMDVYRVQELPEERIQEQPLPGDGDEPVTRVSGDDRIDTSVQTSAGAFDAADTAILARSDDFPDALTGASLASETEAPILLTDSDGLDARVADELERLGVEQAYLLGGPVALSRQVADDVRALDIDVERVAGPDRYATAVEIADEVVDLGGEVDRVAVALGDRADGRDAFPDALGGANLAMNLRVPILLTTPDDVPDRTIEAVERIGGGERTYVLGGPDAISADAVDELEEVGPVRRLAGETRYGTAVKILEVTQNQMPGVDLDPLYLASGSVFPDALAAAPAAFHVGGALLLVHPDDLDLSAATRDEIDERSDEIGRVVMVGGEQAISASVRDAVAALLGS